MKSRKHDAETDDENFRHHEARDRRILIFNVPRVFRDEIALSINLEFSRREFLSASHCV